MSLPARHVSAIPGMTRQRPFGPEPKILPLFPVLSASFRNLPGISRFFRFLPPVSRYFRVFPDGFKLDIRRLSSVL
jgi:hypothetical protein